MQITPIKSINHDEARIREIFSDWKKAFRAKDLATAVQNHAPFLVVYDAVPPLASTGLDTFCKTMELYFDDFETGIDFEMRDLTVAASGDVAYCHGLARISGTRRSGKHSITWMRWSGGLRKVADRWLIQHQHMSVPVDRATNLGQLDLKP